ncbi:MAG: hypothetical protein ACKVP4_08200 [Hyphomicrobium sp.]
MSRAAYEDCQSRDEPGLKAAITAVSTEALRNGVKTIDYSALLAEEWRKSGIDEVIDKRVDIAVDEVRSETSWSELLQSLANAEASQKLATTVAERVYRSETVKASIETLASGVAAEVGETIEFASADATSPLLDCLKAFLGPRYGAAVAEAVAGDANRDLSLNPQSGSGEVSAGSVLKQSGGGIAGATLIIVRRQLANLATRLGQRLVGSVLSRLVSVAAGGVGLVLIAKDVWELRNGVLPIIATEMKAKATKEKVQQEIAASLSDQINQHLSEIAASSADHVVEIWQSFKRAHALVLKIAETDATFRTFLDGVKPASLVRLDEVVALLVASEGDGSVLKRLNDGSLNIAVHQMPDAAMTIARDSKSVAAALDWTALAGSDLPVVLDLDLHRRAKASDFTATSFRKLLGLGDKIAIQRLAAAPVAERDALLNLDAGQLTTLAKSLSTDELTTLSGYLTGLPDAPRERILRAIATDPAKMRVLASTRVRDAILSSADQAAAADMMLSANAGSTPRDFYNAAVAAWSGRINPWLIWHKHPIGIAGLLLAALLALAWLTRLFRARPTPGGPPTSAST